MFDCFEYYTTNIFKLNQYFDVFESKDCVTLSLILVRYKLVLFFFYFFFLFKLCE